MLYVIVGIIIILILVFIGIFNNLVTLRKKAMQSESGVDVYLQQRFDLIPNLVEVTKGYMEHEQETLVNIAKLRAEYNKNKNEEAAIALTEKYKSIMAIIENYPNLKASEQFLKLQKALIKVESQLQAARRIYNNDVTRYNTKISTFPTNIIAKLFNFKEMKLFMADSDVNEEVKFLWFFITINWRNILKYVIIITKKIRVRIKFVMRGVLIWK